MSSSPERSAPFTWPHDMYALAELPGSGRYGERLQLCVRHHGQHVVHGRTDDEWCQELGMGRPGPRVSRLHESTEPPLQRVVVDLDYDALAEALGHAVELVARRLRVAPDRQPSRTEPEPAAAPPPNDMPTIQVWRPDDDDDA